MRGEDGAREPPSTTKSAPRRRAHPVRRLARWLLVLPVAAWLFPPLYARTTPRLGALPFFIWYQLAAAVGTGVIIGVVFLARERPGRTG